jgi:hypothetical protein
MTFEGLVQLQGRELKRLSSLEKARLFNKRRSLRQTQPQALITIPISLFKMVDVCKK